MTSCPGSLLSRLTDGIAPRSACAWAVPVSPEPVKTVLITISIAAIKMGNLTHRREDRSFRAAEFIGIFPLSFN